MGDWETTHRTILVLDDSEVALEFCRLAFESAGYRVITRSKPAGSVAAILRQQPDVVLLDVNMPVLSGDSIAKILSKVVGNRMLLILHANLPAETLRLKVLSTGAHGYVQKTDSPTELVHRVEDWVFRTRTSGSMRASLPMPESVFGRPARSTDVSNPPLGAKVPNVAPASSTRLVAASPSRDPSPSSGRIAIGDPSRAYPPSGTIRVPIRVLFADTDRDMLEVFRREFALELAAEYVFSGGDALTRILSDEPPEAVVTATALPGTSGPELYRCARVVDPSFQQRFIFMTDSKMTIADSNFLNEVGARVFYKPIAPQTLLEAVRRFDRDRRIARSR